MYSWHFNICTDAVMKEVNLADGEVVRVRFLEGEREWRLPGLLYVDDLFMCCELEENLKVRA